MQKKFSSNQPLAPAPQLPMSAWQEHNLAAISQRLLPFQDSRPGILFEQVTPYNHIIVRRSREQLMLCYRHTSSQIEEIESRLIPATPLALPSAYTQAMLLALIWQPEPKRILLIGLGGGRLQMALHHYMQQVVLHTVELDPVIVEVAERFFGICQDKRQHLMVQDGREYLRNAAAHTSYDIIILDAYRVEGIPLHLSTQEFYNECRARLAPGGVVATNLQSGTPGYDATRKTFDAAFQHTMVFPLFGGNVIAIGSDLARDCALGLALTDEQEFHTRVGLVEQRFLGQILLARLAQTRDKKTVYRQNVSVLHDRHDQHDRHDRHDRHESAE